jgi:hypothetical protein
MARFVLSLVALLLLAATHLCLANEAPPLPPRKAPPPAQTSAPLVVAFDDAAREPRLEIPRAILGRLRASADDGADDGTRRVQGVSPWHTILGGIAISSALVLGGLWLVRSRSRTGAKAAGLLLAAAAVLTISGSLLWADIPPFGRGRPVPPPAAEKIVAGIPLSDKVTIEVVDNGEAIRLVVSKGQFAKVLTNGSPNNEKPTAPTAEPLPKK